jgi:hypothetical protein
LSFNVGVEIGQVMIVVLVWLVISLLRKVTPRTASVARIATASLALGISAVWLVERIGMVKEVL